MPGYDHQLRLVRATQMVKASLSAYFRRCYGPEYISGTLLAWAEKRNITITHIQPGKPQQNVYIERDNRTVRHEWRGCFIFDTIKEVQDHATRWLWTYNNDRPNMAIGGITPRQKLTIAA